MEQSTHKFIHIIGAMILTSESVLDELIRTCSSDGDYVMNTMVNGEYEQITPPMTIKRSR